MPMLNYKEVRERLEATIDEVFAQEHKRAGTTSGDITPDQAFELDDLLDQLADLITTQVNQNLEEYWDEEEGEYIVNNSKQYTRGQLGDMNISDRGYRLIDRLDVNEEVTLGNGMVVKRVK